MTELQRRILSAMRHEGSPWSTFALADELDVSHSEVTRAVRELLAEGAVTLEGDLAYLTRKGRILLNRQEAMV